MEKLSETKWIIRDTFVSSHEISCEQACEWAVILEFVKLLNFISQVLFLAMLAALWIKMLVCQLVKMSFFWFKCLDNCWRDFHEICYTYSYSPQHVITLVLYPLVDFSFTAINN